MCICCIPSRDYLLVVDSIWAWAWRQCGKSQKTTSKANQCTIKNSNVNIIHNTGSPDITPSDLVFGGTLISFFTPPSKCLYESWSTHLEFTNSDICKSADMQMSNTWNYSYHHFDVCRITYWANTEIQSRTSSWGCTNFIIMQRLFCFTENFKSVKTFIITVNTNQTWIFSISYKVNIHHNFLKYY